MFGMSRWNVLAAVVIGFLIALAFTLALDSLPPECAQPSACHHVHRADAR